MFCRKIKYIFHVLIIRMLSSHFIISGQHNQKGKAKVCKTLILGSNPSVAFKFFKNKVVLNRMMILKNQAKELKLVKWHLGNFRDTELPLSIVYYMA